MTTFDEPCTVAAARALCTQLARFPDLTPARLVQAAADLCSVPYSSVRGGRRLREYVDPRHLAMYLQRTLLGLSYTRIARWWGRDHTTVLHACRRVSALLGESP